MGEPLKQYISFCELDITVEKGVPMPIRAMPWHTLIVANHRAFCLPHNDDDDADNVALASDQQNGQSIDTANSHMTPVSLATLYTPARGYSLGSDSTVHDMCFILETE